MDFLVEQVSAEDGGIITGAHIDKVATNEYSVVHRLIPLDPDRQLSDPYSGYKFPFSYAFISGDGNEGQYRPLKGVAFGDSDNKYTSRFKLDGEVGDTEYTLSREGEFQFLLPGEGNAGVGFPITRGNVGDPLAGFEIIFTGAAEATGIGILGASVPSVTPIYGDTTTRVVNVNEIANILIVNVGENIDTFSPPYCRKFTSR